jgi:hypothetical protein
MRMFILLCLKKAECNFSGYTFNYDGCFMYGIFGFDVSIYVLNVKWIYLLTDSNAATTRCRRISQVAVHDPFI